MCTQACGCLRPRSTAPPNRRASLRPSTMQAPTYLEAVPHVRRGPYTFGFRARLCTSIVWFSSSVFFFFALGFVRLYSIRSVFAFGFRARLVRLYFTIFQNSRIFTPQGTSTHVLSLPVSRALLYASQSAALRGILAVHDPFSSTPQLFRQKGVAASMDTRGSNHIGFEAKTNVAVWILQALQRTTVRVAGHHEKKLSIPLQVHRIGPSSLFASVYETTDSSSVLSSDSASFASYVPSWSALMSSRSAQYRRSVLSRRRS